MSNNLFSLQNKTALITGSSRGIGKAIARAFASAGARVWVHGIHRNEQADKTVNEITEQGHDARFIAGDLGAVNGGATLAKQLLNEEPKGIDILVLNASMQIRKPWNEITSAEYEIQMRINFQSSLELIQSLSPSMQQKRWGRILTIGSVQQARPHPDMLVYSASKAAQVNMVISLSKQLAPDGITINNLAPGVILTDRNTDALANPDYAEKVRATIPVRYFAQPEDCAGTALLLCSDAGRYITGQDIYVDGGMSLP